jgi:hypothetical protein
VFACIVTYGLWKGKGDSRQLVSCLFTNGEHCWECRMRQLSSPKSRNLEVIFTTSRLLTGRVQLIAGVWVELSWSFSLDSLDFFHIGQNKAPKKTPSPQTFETTTRTVSLLVGSRKHREGRFACDFLPTAMMASTLEPLPRPDKTRCLQCGHLESPIQVLRRCSKCRVAPYCSVEW